MTRYIDADKLIEQFDDTCKYAKPTNDYQRGCNEVFDWFVKIIKNIPTGDVAPKSEVERLERICNSYALQYGTVRDQQKVIDEAKAEVIKEIDDRLHDVAVEYYEAGQGAYFAVCEVVHHKVIRPIEKKYT